MNVHRTNIDRCRTCAYFSGWGPCAQNKQELPKGGFFHLETV